jgi:hypothetical protein
VLLKEKRDINRMAKWIPLVRRLDTELGTTTSEGEEDRVYARLHRVALKARTAELEEFYTKIAPHQIRYEEGEMIPRKEEVSAGRSLAKRLYESIPPLLPPDNTRGQNKRIIAKKRHYALLKEFEILRELSEEKGGDGTES